MEARRVRVMNKRSYEKITNGDLRWLAQIALADRAKFLDQHPRYQSICNDKCPRGQTHHPEELLPHAAFE